jgi:hypothetical protein
LRSPEPAKFVHRSRGQLCGQPGSRDGFRQSCRALERIAEVLSKKKVNEINNLRHTFAVCRAFMPLLPRIGAAVELSGGPTARFADD